MGGSCQKCSTFPTFSHVRLFEFWETVGRIFGILVMFCVVSTFFRPQIFLGGALLADKCETKDWIPYPHRCLPPSVWLRHYSIDLRQGPQETQNGGIMLDLFLPVSTVFFAKNNTTVKIKIDL